MHESFFYGSIHFKFGGIMAKTKETREKPAVKKPAPAEKKPAAMPNDTGEMRSAMSTKEAADYLGVDISRISQFKKEGVITPLPSGSKKKGDFYKPLETFIKIARHYRMLADSRGSRETEEMVKAKERRMIARAKKEELELSEYESGLHKTEDIERVMGAVLTRLRINLLSIPKGAAPQLRNQNDETVIAGKIHERIVRALNEVVNLDLDELLEEDENGRNPG
jgi:phage terminase Nu1 subunit (DNA packaging protein)